MKTKPWDRKLWGVVISRPKAEPFLVATTWDHIYPLAYPGETTQPLLFWEQIHACTWCRTAAEKYARHGKGWKFKAVRVRERVEVIP